MLHSLQNSLAVATFKEQGAELCSLRRKDVTFEYIWGANPDIWGRHAPILFPIVGRLDQNKYQLNGKDFHLSQHGFARDKTWQVAEEAKDSILFRLTSDAETKKHYPFDFELLLQYQLSENTLSTTYRIKNTGADVLPFSIGGHPAFNCPLLPNEQFTDYFLEFEKPETLHRQLLHHGLRTGETAPVLEDQTTLVLSPELFQDDALVFEGVKSDYITLKNSRNLHSVRVDIKGFPYLGIWTKAGGAPYICLEPWFGVTDKIHSSGQDFRQKEGILQIHPGQQFECGYAITIE